MFIGLYLILNIYDYIYLKLVNYIRMCAANVCLSRISVTDPPSNHVQPFRLSEILGVRNLFVQIFEDVLAAWRRAGD